MALLFRTPLALLEATNEALEYVMRRFSCFVDKIIFASSYLIPSFLAINATKNDKFYSSLILSTVFFNCYFIVTFDCRSWHRFLNVLASVLQSTDTTLETPSTSTVSR